MKEEREDKQPKENNLNKWLKKYFTSLFIDIFLSNPTLTFWLWQIKKKSTLPLKKIKNGHAEPREWRRSSTETTQIGLQWLYITFVMDINILKARHHYQLLFSEHNICDTQFLPSKCLLSNEKSQLWHFVAVYMIYPSLGFIHIMTTCEAYNLPTLEKLDYGDEKRRNSKTSG